jgi:hypothetical protein
MFVNVQRNPATKTRKPETKNHENTKTRKHESKEGNWPVLAVDADASSTFPSMKPSDAYPELTNTIPLATTAPDAVITWD